MTPTREPMSAESVQRVVGAIEAGWHEALSAIREAEAIRTAELRSQYERLARRFLVMTCVLVLSVVGGLVSFKVQLNAASDQANRLDGVIARQARQRRIALVDRCRQTNGLTTGLRVFVRKVSPRLLPLAERIFHVEPDCARYADRLLRATHPPTPPPHR